MICKNRVKQFCSEDISLIENYQEAINDTTQTWQCHHRLEIELNKSGNELINMNLYYNRPASELIFLTEKNHKSLHYKSGMSNFSTKYGKDNPMYSKHHSEETKQKMSVSHKGLTPINKGVPQIKYKWLTSSGEIKEMDEYNVKRWHPDWIKIGEV